MANMIKKLYLLCALLVTMVGTGLTVVPPAYACTDTYFAVPAWYKGIQNGDCSIKAPSDVKNFALKIGLNIIQALLVIVAYISVFFIIKGGFNYMTSAGDPGGTANARKTITNAVIGMIIAALSASIVNAVAGVVN